MSSSQPTVKVYMTPAMFEAVKSLAESRRVSAAEYIRQLIVRDLAAQGEHVESLERGGWRGGPKSSRS